MQRRVAVDARALAAGQAQQHPQRPARGALLGVARQRLRVRDRPLQGVRRAGGPALALGGRRRGGAGRAGTHVRKGSACSGAPASCSARSERPAWRARLGGPPADRQLQACQLTPPRAVLAAQCLCRRSPPRVRRSALPLDTHFCGAVRTRAGRHALVALLPARQVRGRARLARGSLRPRQHRPALRLTGRPRRRTRGGATGCVRALAPSARGLLHALPPSRRKAGRMLVRSRRWCRGEQVAVQACGRPPQPPAAHAIECTTVAPRSRAAAACTASPGLP